MAILAMRGQEDTSHGLILCNQKLVREKRPFANLAAEEEEFTDPVRQFLFSDIAFDSTLVIKVFHGI